MEYQRTSTGVIVALVAIQVLFGINFSASKIIVEQMDPLFWSNIRFLISFIFLAALAIALKRPHPKVDKTFLSQVIPLGLFGMGIGQSLLMVGLEKTTSLNTAIISSSIPILTLVIVVIRRIEKLNIFKAVGFCAAIGGALTIRGIENFSLADDAGKGDLLVFLASLSIAIYISFGKEFLQKYDTLWATVYMFLVSAIAMFFISFEHWIHLGDFQIDTNFILCALYSVLCATVLTYFLNNWAMQKAPPGTVALFIYLQPVVAAIFGVQFLDEPLTTRMIVASILIFSGLIISTRTFRRQDQCISLFYRDK